MPVIKPLDKILVVRVYLNTNQHLDTLRTRLKRTSTCIGSRAKTGRKRSRSWTTTCRCCLANTDARYPIIVVKLGSSCPTVFANYNFIIHKSTALAIYHVIDNSGISNWCNSRVAYQQSEVKKVITIRFNEPRKMALSSSFNGNPRICPRIVVSPVRQSSEYICKRCFVRPQIKLNNP